MNILCENQDVVLTVVAFYDVVKSMKKLSWTIDPDVHLLIT